jgi:hypothetical protein
MLVTAAKTSENWFTYKLLRSSDDPKKEIAYTTHLDAINKAFSACNIISSKKTHAARGFLELLKQLRISFLQDSIFMSEKHPGHSLWQNEMFSTIEYIQFKRYTRFHKLTIYLYIYRTNFHEIYTFKF